MSFPAAKVLRMLESSKAQGSPDRPEARKRARNTFYTQKNARFETGRANEEIQGRGEREGEKGLIVAKSQVQMLHHRHTFSMEKTVCLKQMEHFVFREKSKSTNPGVSKTTPFLMIFAKEKSAFSIVKTI